ncbi:MAG: ABC transporter permease [Trueperaceae bacterium]|nr:ABC transporter permease [Trueperaceae bacterium]MBX3142139.1 ABC transporter permease [Trueperaceae bacterium]MCC6310717.1 ABC transporter permease [Trueperaceae bacterium]MCO5173544.1 ABC transporter permease [Trueperaceae bacterium]MCW5818532.1 ABC transporter permease [Trueperaceae bacterium]
MTSYLLRRLWQFALVLLGVSAVTFAITNLTGSPAALLLPPDAGRAQVEALTQRLGLDQPLHVQYWRFLTNALRGDFGNSLRQGRPAIQVVAERVPATALLGLTALALSVLVAVPVGTFTAVRRGTAYDTLATAVVLFGQSLPSFWLGLMLILVFGVTLRVLPISGMGSWLHLIGPAVTLSFFPAARNIRMLRSSVIETLNMDFVRTARSKGLAEHVVVRKHVLRNALIPFVTIVGLQIGFVLGGAVIVETIFAWPGIGRLMVQAVQGRDFPVIQAGVVLIAATFMVVNLLTDLLYAVLNPRIRLR